MPPDITLQPGQTAFMPIIPGLKLKITNEGWTLKVECEGGAISLGLISSREITIGTKNSAKAVDEFLGIEC